MNKLTKSCVNCYSYADSSDEEPCSSCDRNPNIPFSATLKDNWKGYTLGEEVTVESKNPNIGKYTVRQKHEAVNDDSR